MAEKTDNYETDYISNDHYIRCVQLRHECNDLLTKAERTSDRENSQKFKWFLKLYYREMYPKFEERQDVEDPVDEDEEINELTLGECESVLMTLNLLQNKLGITSKAYKRYEKTKEGAEIKNA